MFKLIVASIYPIFVIFTLLLTIPFIKNFKYRKELLFTSGSMSILLLLFTLIYFKFENTIYFWDSSGQWSNLIYLKQAFDYSLDFIGYELYQSICFTEYSKLPAFFLLLPIYYLGLDFSVFVFSMISLFIIPTCILTAFIVLRSLNEEIVSSRVTILAVTGSFLFFPFLFSTFEGELGVVGLYFIALIIWLMDYKSWQRISIIKIVFMVIAIVTLIFIRRWFIFWVIAYFIARFLFYFIQYYYKKINAKSLLNVIMNMAIMTIGVILILYIGFKPFVDMVLNNNYAESYVAYRISFINQTKQVLNYYGLFIIIGVFISIKQSWKTHNMTSLTLVLQIIIAFSLFSMIQSFDLHHYYIISFEISLLFLQSLIVIINYLKNKLFYVFTISLLIIQFITKMFFPTNVASVFFGNLSNEPESRNDIEEIRNCVNDLNTITNGESLYIFASSLKMNDQILNNIDLPYKINALENRIATYHIDERDGFPYEMFEALYILIADPIQLHKSSEHQKVIEVLSNELMRNETFFRKYEYIKSYDIDDIKLNLYARIDDFSALEKTQLINIVLNN